MIHNTANPEIINNGIEENEIEPPYATVIERKVLIQQYDYAVRTLMDMITDGDLILDPDYQRNYRWKDDKASRFIESMALNIPVPVIYMAEEADGTFSVIDGQQRLTSLFRYFRPTELPSIFPEREIEELIPNGLKIRDDINNKRFVDLNRIDRSVLTKRPIRCIVVLNESDSTLKFEVFERLNTGSASLTNQEVRNCIYRGSYNKLIKKLASNHKFQEMISLPELTRNTMKDAELVLRFFAYRALTDKTDYSDNYTEYLNDHMEDNREISDAYSKEIEILFNKTVDLIYKTLKPGTAFRRPSDREISKNTTFAHAGINGAIYESQMVAVSNLIEKGITPPRNLQKRILSIFNDDAYWNSLFQGTSKKAKALRRNELLTKQISD